MIGDFSPIPHYDESIIKMDFDLTKNQRLVDVKKWCRRVTKRYKLKGFAIFRSSNNHYHAIFDREVSWADNVKVMAWLTLISGNFKKLPEMVRFTIMQAIKKSSTLRLFKKGKDKPIPRLVYREGSQDGAIKVFLNNKRTILGICNWVSRKFKGKWY